MQRGADTVGRPEPGTRLRVAGLMSGTSMDGLDICITDISMDGDLIADFTVIAGGTVDYPEDLRGRIRDCLTGTAAEICALNYDLGRWFANALHAFTAEHGIDKLDLISSHGQTLHHIPGHSTLQIGETAFLADAFSCPVVSDLRAADIASGGSGAPLMPWVDNILYRRRDTGLILLNIGGVANVSILSPVDHPKPLLGFDTGPGMALLDEYYFMKTSRYYDPDGQEALKGTPDRVLLGEFMKHSFISAPFPKSTGRDVFGPSWLNERVQKLDTLAVRDALATLTALTASAVASNVTPLLKEYRIGAVYVSGGGAKHKGIMRALEQHLPSVSVAPLPTGDPDPDMKEAFGMALFGYAHACGLPVDLRSVTGAGKNYIPGKNFTV